MPGSCRRCSFSPCWLLLLASVEITTNQPRAPHIQMLHEMGARTIGVMLRHLVFFTLFNHNLATGEPGDPPMAVWARTAKCMALTPGQVGAVRTSLRTSPDFICAEKSSLRPYALWQRGTAS